MQLIESVANSPDGGVIKPVCQGHPPLPTGQPDTGVANGQDLILVMLDTHKTLPNDQKNKKSDDNLHNHTWFTINLS